MVLFYNTDSTATLGFLDKVESSFYQQIFSRKFSVPKVSQEIADIVEGVDPVKLVRPKHKSQPPPGVPFDGSSLERWRIPDEPVAGFLQTCQVPSSQNEIHKKLMLSVRESYVARTGMPEQGVRKLAKKPSALSNASTTSATSSGGQVRRTGRSGKSRGEMLKDLSVLNRSSAVLDTEGTVKKEEATGENEMLEEKTQSAEAMMMKMGSPNVATDLLIDRLVEIQGRVISSGEDVELAGYSEACISFLLKHLDTTGVNKSSLEEVVTARLLADVATVARNSKNDLALRVSQHKVQVLLMAEVHWLLANQESQEEYEESILAHMRQMSLHGGQELMTDFLSGPLTQFYVVRQPDLLCLLYDELELQRPSNLNLCSPATSLQPNSVKSISSLGPSSASSMQPPAILVNKPKVNLSRSFRSRPKSFDTSLTSRQIDLSVAGRRVKKSTKLVTTGRMVSSKLRVSGKKKLAGAKSPKKTKQMVKRNLNFDGSGKSPDRGKSPRKNISVTTPSKARKYQSSRSLRTPGKTHKILCPETPASKVRRRKSDGNTSVAETPEKTEESLTPRRQQASMAVRRRASFYPGNVPSSLTTTSQLNLSLANTTTLDMTSVLDESQMGLNKSLVLFPHLHNRKRKREDSFEDPADEEEGKSPLRKARKRLNSFSEQLSSLAKPFESTHLFSTAQLGQHLGQHIEQHLGDKLNISSIPNLHTTPVKRLSGADFFSPSKKVHFNMKPQPPTPKSGLKAKSILKTPGKESPVTKTTFKTPVKTPSKVAVKLMQSPAPPSSSSCRPLTPVRVTPRKNLGQGSSKTLCLTEPGETLLTPVKTTRSASPSSPIFSSSKKRRRLSIGARVSEESQSPGLKVPSSQDHFLPPLMSTLQPAGDGVSKKIPTAFNPGLVSTKIDLHLTASRSATMTTQDIINSTSLPSLSSTVIKPSSHLQSDIFENSALVPPAMAATLKTEFVLPVVEGATTPETTPTKCLELTPVKAGGLEEEEELELLSPLKGSGKSPRRISLAPPSPRPLSKKSRRSVRSVFYKEYESEESQTDDEEYMRIVEERFGDGQKTEDGHDNNDNKAKKPASKIVVRSPVRFKCKFCGGGFRTRKSLLAHEAEELESQKLRSQEQTSVDEFSHEAEVSLGKKTIDCEEEKEEERCVKKAPKMISSLQDQLSSYFSPSSSSGRARRNTDRLSDVYSLAQLTPRSSRPSNRALARTRTLERGATSTPNDSQNISRTQRTSRARNVSYAEFPDFDSTDSDVSLCEDGPRRTLANKMVVSTRPSVSPLVSFNSGKALVVKNLNDSQEIEDLTDRIRSRDVSPLATPEKTEEIWSGDTSLASPGKYFSVGQITETPTGQIKLRINRTSKPQQSTPLVSDQPRTKQTNRKKAEPLWLPKMSRSACREMGMSPGRLVSIMTSKTPPKPPAVTEKTPEKENLPHAAGKLREDNGINKTPRIRIKKISSINPSSSSNWQVKSLKDVHFFLILFSKGGNYRVPREGRQRVPREKLHSAVLLQSAQAHDLSHYQHRGKCPHSRPVGISLCSSGLREAQERTEEESS